MADAYGRASFNFCSREWEAVVEFLLADITRAYVATEVDVLTALLEETAWPPEKLFIVSTERQKSVIQRERRLAGALVESLEDSPAAEDVASKILQMLAAQPLSDASSVTVFSFHPAVFALAAKLPDDQRERVRFDRMARFSSPSAGARVEKSFPWPSELMPVDEAARILRESLRQVRALDRSSGVRKTDLRPLLARTDARLDKENPPAARPGIVSLIVEQARRLDYIIIEETTTNPRVWLADGADNARPATAPADMRVRAISGPPVGRSQMMLDILREGGLGPFKEVRLFAYDQVEELINDQDNHTLISLLAKVVDRIKDARAELIPKEGLRDRYPYRLFRKFFLNLLAARPVLLDDTGERVLPIFSHTDRQVSSLVENWRLELDGELVLYLAARMDLALQDADNLSGALTESHDNEDYINDIIRFLIGSGRLTESRNSGDTGLLRIPERLPGESGQLPTAAVTNHEDTGVAGSEPLR